MMSGENKFLQKCDMPWEFERDRCALLVIDMQNDFVAEGAIMQVKEAGRQVPKIKKLIAKCRELGVPIIYTLQRTDAVFCPLEVAVLPWLKEAGMREGTWGAEIFPELAPQPDDLLVWKRRFSGFFQTDLEILLRNIRGGEKPVDTVIISGTVTNICCESTARDAFFRDYKIVFGSDINSAHDEEAHNATLYNMGFFGRVLDCEAIIKALENGRG
jgi:ureidoacrylate peracid hydrolase